MSHTNTQTDQPGIESKMQSKPVIIKDNYKGSEKLRGKTAVISGGDSGIGRSIAVHFAREGADITIIYLNEDIDAIHTKELVEKEGARCLSLSGDVSNEEFCRESVKKTIKTFSRIDILVNNIAEQHPKEEVEQISSEQLNKTFRTNFYGYIYLTQFALPHMKAGSSIINTSSVTAYRGSHHLIDYASTKGAISTFTRSLAQSLAEKNIRVNEVAPGPIWTPLIPASFNAEKVRSFGQNTLLARAGQPCEVAPSYVFLASEDGSYFTGQALHPNGGALVSM